MNLIYRIANPLIACVGLSTIAVALYLNAADAWKNFDNACVGSFAIVSVVGSLAIGFLLLESRKI